MNPKMSLVCPKMAEKHEFKDTYPPQKGKTFPPVVILLFLILTVRLEFLGPT